MTELQEINENLRICEAQIMFFTVAGGAEWLHDETARVRAKIEPLAEEIRRIRNKHRDAAQELRTLEQRKARLLKMKSINTDAAIKKLLELQKKVDEMNVDASAS